MSGHAGPAPVADIASESFPEYGQSLHSGYLDGYDPVSLGAPHSSLMKTRTWVGMGLMLASLAGIGTLIYAAGTHLWGHGASPDITNTLFIVGGVFTAVTLIGAIIAIVSGRSGYKAYRKETGRLN
ncbi:hypothetical protein [Corynebacterium sp. CCUG 71335]|uniref:hypothetical protein n=1 Tax=Corynebacterium sp. CCUG 71335 TaxID=2823892 RepID=UPI00210D2269|nr:hypothetical protein [Corynebacterium sp. CCUG 71335]